LVSCSAQFALTFSLTAGNRHDAPEGKKLLSGIASNDKHYLIMDRAYEGSAIRKLAAEQGFIPVVPPKSNRKEPWAYDKEVYKKRNEVERLIRRLKRFRRVFTRYDKLDVVFAGVVMFAMIIDALLC
jgi:transposase